MKLRDLEYLVAVYDHGSFSKAADHCHVSQPTLSGQIRKLEEELDVSLMERSTRKIIFTPLGKQVVERARDLVNGAGEIKSLVRERDGELNGPVRIGLIPTVGPYLLPLIITEFSKRFPGAELFLQEGQTHQLLEQVSQGELDGAILARLDGMSAFNLTPLYDETMLLAVPPSHDLADKASVEYSDLAEQKLLMLEDGHCLRDQALGYCFSADATEDPRFQATSLETLRYMVAANVGITLIPELAVATDTGGAVCYLPFEDPKPAREIVLLTRRKFPRQTSFDLLASWVTETAASQRLT